MLGCGLVSGRRLLLPAGLLLLVSGGGLAAQTTQPVEGTTGQPPAAAESPATETQPAGRAAHPRSGGWGTRLETEPPGYVRPLSESGIPGFESVDWLDFGLEHRTRFEYRSDYRRSNLADDNQFLLRSRVYFGIRRILDPLRLVVEFQDCRQFNSDFGDRTRDVDEADFLQAFAELHFEDALGEGYPLAFRSGRMTLEYVDRRLVGRNRWRNTTNSFDGFRLRLGQPTSDWQVDVFAVQPVERLMTKLNRTDEERWFYGLVGAWRTWSRYVTLQPYYYVLDEDRNDPDQVDRELHTLGLHAFGPIGQTGFDYDLDTAFQFGERGGGRHRAFAVYGELGYTFQHAWRPRLAFSTAYATGDQDPDDETDERFDRLFEATHPWSMSDLFSWQNTITPKLRLSLKPTKKLSVDTSYGGYWLANASDAWVIPGRQDPGGDSGSFVGQEVEIRLRYRLHRRLELEAGYAHFFPGGFVEETGPCDDADMFYVQTTLRF